MNDFFPPPTAPEDPSQVSVGLAYIVKVMTCETAEIAFAATVPHEDGSHTIYRFVLPSHSRLATRFFRKAGIRPNRVRETWDVDQGGFLIGFTGTRVGTDAVPEIDEKNPLREVVVLEQVTISQTS